MTARVEVKKVFEGRCGRNLTPVFEVYVDGELVGFSKLKWLAQAIGDAIVEGKIEGTGDTTARFAQWAHDNAPEVFARIPDRE